MTKSLQITGLLRKCFEADKICIFYRGQFDDTFTDKLISLADMDVEKKAKKRISFLMYESFQNIVRHGNEEIGGKNDSLFGIRAVNPFSHIFSSNHINEKDKTFLEEKLNTLNTLNKEQIRILYTKVLEEGTLSAKGGAGLGLIEMAKKSEKPLQTKFKKLADNIFEFDLQIDMVIDGMGTEGELESSPMPIEENTAMYDLMQDNNMIFLYKGEFSDETISPMLNILEGNAAADTKQSVGYKIYHAAVELMQNVVRHSSSEEKDGIFAMNKGETGYFLCTGNYIGTDIKRLEEQVNELNALNKEELDKLYRTKLKASVSLPGNNAGVGLIDLRRSFMTPIEIKLTEDKKGNYLTIGIEIPFNNGK